MGAITCSIDPNLVRMLQSKELFEIFVETGTFKGDSIAIAAPYFEKIISIELSESLWKESTKRFVTNSKIDIKLGSSSEELCKLHNHLKNVATLYWLDSHSDIVKGDQERVCQSSLLDELKAIGVLNPYSIILIDDARLFIGPPPAAYNGLKWPSFQRIIHCLLSMSSQHEIMVINDVIIFSPPSMKTILDSYAQHFGIDWLLASNALKAHNHPSTLNILHWLQSIDANQKRLEVNQQKFINKSRGIFSRFNLKIKKYIRPKLGKLHQYPPRPIKIPAKSYFNSKKSIDYYPSISVVTPSFSQGIFIEKTILSVLEQEYPVLEYFVQDGGSMDETVDILKKYESKLTDWQSEKDNGQSEALNRGFAKTTGEIMAWINSDDIFLPGAFSTVASYFNRYPEIDVIYGNRLLIDENDMQIGRWILPQHDHDVLSWVDFIPQETLFWRRRVWEKVGGSIDESFHFAMDWDLLARFRHVRANFMHIDCFLGAFRVYSSQKTSLLINDVGDREMARIRQRLLGRVPHYSEINRAVRPYMRKHIVADLTYQVRAKLKI